jgi:hypothetical protein
MNKEDKDDEIDIDKIASVRKWLTSEADKLALSKSELGFLHSSLRDEEVLWEYDRNDLSDLNDIGPF